MLLLSSLLFAPTLGTNCAADHFKKTDLITVGCAPASGSVNVNLARGESAVITHFPPNAKLVDISITATGDLDLCLFDDDFSSCTHNALHCVAGYQCNLIGGAGGAANYQGMAITFSGDRITPPVTEGITIDKTSRDMYLNVNAYSALTGTVTYSYQGVDPCGTTDTGTDTCLPCNNWDQCQAGEHPVCDGSTTVTCASCAAGEEWVPTEQQCKVVQPVCLGGNYATAQVGMLAPGLFGGPETESNGCCTMMPVAATRDYFCESTGDPHIHQFNGQTNHAYINGDYWLYNGQKLQVAVRHVKKGTVAGNNAFWISGTMLGGHKLEYHDQDTVTPANGVHTDSRIFIDGTAILSDGTKDRYTKACDFFMDRNIVCHCTWEDGLLRMSINDKTLFTVERWNNGLGWNNVYLSLDPHDKNDADTGMCTSDAMSNRPDQAGKPRGDPYPEARMDCGSDVFTQRRGTSSAGLTTDDYFCGAAGTMRRRRISVELADCQRTKLALFTEAYQICQPCVPLGQARIESCILDACMMDDAEMARGETQGCTHEIIMLTEPAQRAARCPPGTSFKESVQACMGTFDTKRSTSCSSSPRYTLSSTVLKDCHKECEDHSYCHAYDFDAGRNICRIFDSCTAENTNAGVYLTLYVKAVAHDHQPILARGGSFNGGSSGSSGSSGPVGYNGGGNSGSSSTVHTDISQHTGSINGNIDDVSDAVQELRQLITGSQSNIDGLENQLTEDIDEVNDVVRELRTMLAHIGNNQGNAPSSPSTVYYPQNPQGGAYQGTYGQPAASPSTSNNDDWKTVGIISAVMSFVLLGGGAIGASVYFCCMRK